MEDLIKEKWNDILEMVKAEYELSDISYKTWLLPLKLHSVERNKVFVISPESDQGIDIIKKRYLRYIRLIISDIVHEEMEVIIISSQNTSEINRISSSDYSNDEAAKMGLLPNYTFETFVVGNNNNMAHAASLAVAESPAEMYNPLFIYGGSGLGKTHLMQAIAHFIIKEHPNLKVLYVTSETFTNELIESVRSQKMDNKEFRDKYRNIDVLLVDDIQFIIGKESTQEEFFHTFNALYSAHKQIILSSDKPPKEMETLDERFRSRFEWGLIVDIQIPTYETKMAILNKKSESVGYNIPADVKDYVATHINSSIRELEGAINKLIAFSKLSKEPLTVAFAEDKLKDLISSDNKRTITPDYIIKIVSEHFNISEEDIISSKRNADIAKPRQIAMYLCRQLTTFPLDQIGRYFGNRDHTTILHGCKKIGKEITDSVETKTLIDTLIKKINPS